MAMKEAIDQVLRAEAEGKKLIAEARSSAEKMHVDVETRAREIVERAVGEANEAAESGRARARSESDAARSKILADTGARVKRDAREREAGVAAAVHRAMEFLLR